MIFIDEKGPIHGLSCIAFPDAQLQASAAVIAAMYLAKSGRRGGSTANSSYFSLAWRHLNSRECSK